MISNLGSRLLLSRRDLGLNQDELARRVGVDRSYISQIERGTVTNVGVEVVIKLASTLGVSVPYLLGLTDAPLEQNHDGSPLSANDDTLIYRLGDRATRRIVQEIVAAIIEMTPRQRVLLYEIVQRLRDLSESRTADE